MLLAQINRDSQGMAEFHDADGQPVTLCLTEAVTVAGGLSDYILFHLESIGLENWANYCCCYYFLDNFLIICDNICCC